MNQIEKQRTRSIKCPICGKGKLMDASKTINPKMIRLFKPEESNKAECFVKCPKCGSQVGFAVEK